MRKIGSDRCRQMGESFVGNAGRTGGTGCRGAAGLRPPPACEVGGGGAGAPAPRSAARAASQRP